MLHNSFALDIKPQSRHLSTAANTRRCSQKNNWDKDLSTVDTGLVGTCEFRRYPKEETIMSVQPGTTLRQMREQKRAVEEQFKKLSSRVQYQRNKEEKMMNSALVERYKSNSYRIESQKKLERDNLDLLNEEKLRFEKWAKQQEVETTRLKVQSEKKARQAAQVLRRHKDVQIFKRRITSEKSRYQRSKQESLDRVRQQHDNVLRTKEHQRDNIRLLQLQRQSMGRSQLIDRIEMYEDQTGKTMEMIEHLKKQEDVLRRRNNACGKVFLKILQDFDQLKEL